jgi:hypothetical protein
MRKIIVLTIVVFISISLLAQKNKKTKPDIPAFGEVEKADLEMKECDFDNKAEALVLIEEGDLNFLSTNSDLKRRIRIKILTQKGLDWANVHLRFRGEKNMQDITNLEAQTYNLDDKGNIVVTKIEKKLIYEKKINKKYSEKVFTFPEVKVGSIIEYKYKFSGVGLIDWYFQRSIPIRYSHFNVDFPSEIEFKVTPYCSHAYDEKDEDKNTRTSKSFTMNNVPAFRDEPFIINEDFYKDRLEIKVTAFNINGQRINRITNWVQVIKFLMEDEDFGEQLKKNIPRTADLDEKLKKITDSYVKMKTIYKYVQENMQWNEYEGIWAADGVRSAWKDKKGTVGEINLILVNLLKDADINAHPILVSTHDNGIVNSIDAGTYDSPGYLQFNKVMAYVEIGNKFYVLDATEKETPPYLIPPDVLMTEGLVIEKFETFEWGWQLLWDSSMLSKTIMLTKGHIDESGQMQGESSISSYDYAKLGRLPLAKKGKDKFIERYISESNPSVNVEDISFENLDSDSLPLIQNIKFTQSLNSSGDYKYFSANLLSGLEKNPFVADNRFSDVFFGTGQSYQILGAFDIPDDYEFDELPKNIKMIMPDTSISLLRIAQVEEHRLLTKVQLEFKKPAYPATDYSEFQEFYKQLSNLLNEQFVIRKKARL